MNRFVRCGWRKPGADGRWTATLLSVEELGAPRSGRAWSDGSDAGARAAGERASVEVDGAIVGEIGAGLLIFVGGRAGATSTRTAASPGSRLADKVANLRIFPDAEGKSNLSLLDTGGAALVISQFTLYADYRRGRRPSFSDAADPGPAEALVDDSGWRSSAWASPRPSGRFAAHMIVSLSTTVRTPSWSTPTSWKTPPRRPVRRGVHERRGDDPGRGRQRRLTCASPTTTPTPPAAATPAGRPPEYVEAARAAGLLAIGIADHLPLLPEPDPELSMDACELGDYVAEVQELKDAFPGFVLLGVEADYRPETVSEVRCAAREPAVRLRHRLGPPPGRLGLRRPPADGRIRAATSTTCGSSTSNWWATRPNRACSPSWGTSIW